MGGARTAGALLRGARAVESAGARGIEKAARGRGCLRRIAMALAGVSPETVVSEVYGAPSSGCVSPFATAAGVRFESRLLQSGAAELLSIYRCAGRLSPSEGRAIDMSRILPGTDEKMRRIRLEATSALLKRKLSDRANAPNIIIKGRLTLRIFGQEHVVEPDALVAADSSPFYLPIEVKSFIDRGGRTPASEIRGALRQSAVSVLALRQFLSECGVDAPEAIVPPNIDLLIRNGYGKRTSLRPMSVEAEVLSIARLLEDGADAAESIAREAKSGNLAGCVFDRQFIENLPCRLVDDCREHCAMAPHCHADARAKGLPAILGREARILLDPAGSIRRALELLKGEGPPPSSAGERMLAERLAVAERLVDQEVPVVR